MNAIDFATAVLNLSVFVPFSVTSWGRSEAHNASVGGLPLSNHRVWLAVDIVLDHASDRDRLVAMAARLRLRALDEGDHVHLQPLS